MAECIKFALVEDQHIVRDGLLDFYSTYSDGNKY